MNTELAIVDNEFELKETFPTQILEISRDSLSNHSLIFRSQDGFEARISDEIYHRLLVLAKKHAPHEFLGLIVGQICRDDAGLFVVVQGVVPDTQAKGNAWTVQTTHASEASTHAFARTMFPDAVPVGWVHSHIDYGVFFSEQDKQTQQFWTRPYHIGVVVDACRDPSIAVFRGPQAERLSKVEVKPAATSPKHSPVVGKADELDTCVTELLTDAKKAIGIGILLIIVCLAGWFHGRLSALERRATTEDQPIELQQVPSEAVPRESKNLRWVSPTPRPSLTPVPRG